MPKAIVLALLIGGATLFAAAWFSLSAFATIIGVFPYRQQRRRTPKKIFTNIVLPAIGMALTGALWINPHSDALLYCRIWLAIGIIVLAYLTKGFREQLTMCIEEETLADEGTPVIPVKHGQE